MDYYGLLTALKKNNLYIFSLQDIENLFPEENLKTLKNNLTRWIKKGRLARIKRGLYEFIDPGRQPVIPDLYIANKIYSPSYISLETALSIYSVIPDIAVQVTSLTTAQTRTFKNKYGTFFYRTCGKNAFTGYRIMNYEGFKVFIADKEKALVDFIYYRLRSGGAIDLKEERFDKNILKKINWARVNKYAKLFNARTLFTVKKLKGWVKC
jgi:predicted transcriptional regulator of viral defense system